MIETHACNEHIMWCKFFFMGVASRWTFVKWETFASKFFTVFHFVAVTPQHELYWWKFYILFLWDLEDYQQVSNTTNSKAILFVTPLLDTNTYMC